MLNSRELKFPLSAIDLACRRTRCTPKTARTHVGSPVVTLRARFQKCLFIVALDLLAMQHIDLHQNHPTCRQARRCCACLQRTKLLNIQLKKAGKRKERAARCRCGCALHPYQSQVNKLRTIVQVARVCLLKERVM